MKVGDMVNYTGKPFDGPNVGGLILQTKVYLDVDDPCSKKNVLTHQVYWGGYAMTNWVIEKHLEVAA